VIRSGALNDVREDDGKAPGARSARTSARWTTGGGEAPARSPLLPAWAPLVVASVLYGLVLGYVSRVMVS